MKIEKIQKALQAELNRDWKIAHKTKNYTYSNENYKFPHFSTSALYAATPHFIAKYQGKEGQFTDLADTPRTYQIDKGKTRTLPPFYESIERAWPKDGWDERGWDKEGGAIDFDQTIEILERHLISSHTPSTLLIKIDDTFLIAEFLLAKLKLMKRIGGASYGFITTRQDQTPCGMPLIILKSGGGIDLSMLLMGVKNEKLKNGTWLNEHYFRLNKALQPK